ncbi:MAG: hypothetical protein C4538_12910 [Nitrospiraceae bacterium]|nr:MAG: hypothetical protein C4538_12910 [Nitrospiraceae bacterium]
MTIGGGKKEEKLETKFRLLSMATLSRKIHEGISLEELYRDAERKFDTMIGLLKGHYPDGYLMGSSETTIDDLKHASLSILRLLIANKQDNPYMTLCVSEEASQEEIKSRRNKLLQIFHPDRNGDNSSNEIMTKNINEAYEKIINADSGPGISYTGIKTRLRPAAPYNRRQFDIRRKYLLYLFIALVTLSAIAGFFAVLFYS